MFDLWYVVKNKLVDVDIIIEVFQKHCELSQQKVTRAMFEKSFVEKKQDQGFATNMTYLVHPNIGYNFDQACHLVMSTIIEKLP